VDSIELDGKKYISSKSAAKLAGYTQDYVGQLARAGKILATRVGRSWYVEKNALFEHAGVEMESTEVLARKTLINQSQSVRTSHLSPLLQHEVRKPLHSLRTATPSTSLKTWGSLKYLDDDADLAPKMPERTSKETPIPIAVHRKQNIETQPEKQIMDIQPPKKQTMEKISVSVERQSSQGQALALRPMMIGVGTLVALMGLLTSAISGIYVPHDVTFTDAQMASAGFAPYEAVISILMAILWDGLQLVGLFLAYLVNSLAPLFEMGLDFIIGLFPQ
jgi:hypothetical protein